MNVRRLLSDERGEPVELSRSLSDAEWETPSLCAGRRVRDVMGHLQTDAVGLPSYLLIGAQAGSVDGTNAALVEQFSTLPTAELVDRLERAPGWFSRYMPKTALAAAFVHQQDIRRPLGREREVPAERLIAVLDHPDPFARPRRYRKGCAGRQPMSTGRAVPDRWCADPGSLGAGHGRPDRRTR
ncbi:maleylpyruvate isomerase family mycothiol-dependent enzyme [Nocardia acidivorans]|uniref:maleylpyruvate isomerase family mycothiol-dependent enzyme n=1 Tax=Nocardia acidivorans TaxID=404580 RepID=UPI000829DB1C|nr:maleylpyruvate isomerase family mycothiol-dependent enzyme [Nocardia acidivorans]